MPLYILSGLLVCDRRDSADFLPYYFEEAAGPYQGSIKRNIHGVVDFIHLYLFQRNIELKESKIYSLHFKRILYNKKIEK